MTSRTYDHLGGRRLWDWYSVRIERHEGSNGPIKKVFIQSTLHVCKEVEISWCYNADQFSDHDILRDGNLTGKMVEHYGSGLFVGVASDL